MASITAEDILIALVTLIHDNQGLREQAIGLAKQLQEQAVPEAAPIEAPVIGEGDN